MSSSLLILSYRGNGSLTLQSKSKCDMTDVLWMSTLNKQIFRVLSSILPLSLSLTTKVSPCSCGWKRFDVTYSTKIEAGMNCLLQVSWELQNENYHGHRTRMSGLQSTKEEYLIVHVINGCHQFICRPFNPRSCNQSGLLLTCEPIRIIGTIMNKLQSPWLKQLYPSYQR